MHWKAHEAGTVYSIQCYTPQDRFQLKIVHLQIPFNSRLPSFSSSDCVSWSLFNDCFISKDNYCCPLPLSRLGTGTVGVQTVPCPSSAQRLSVLYCTMLQFDIMRPSIKYVTLFLANLDPPPPLSHFITHPGSPIESTSHIPDPPTFSRSSTKIPDKSPLYKFYLNCSQRFLSGGFVRVGFCPFPLCHNTSVTTES